MSHGIGTIEIRRKRKTISMKALDTITLGKENKIFDYLESTLLITEMQKKYMMYTLSHKVALIKVYLGLQKKIGAEVDERFLKRLIYHDTDKFYMYAVLDKKTASNLHRAYSIHHIDSYMGEDVRYSCTEQNGLFEALLDYECARFTKPDKPLNAYNTIQKIYPEAYQLFKYLLEEYEIDGPENVEIPDVMMDEALRDKLISENIECLGKFLNGKGTIEERLVEFNRDLLNICE